MNQESDVIDSGHARCPVCGTPAARVFEHDVLQRHKATFAHCEACEFLFAQHPYWLAEAYKSPIAESDTGLLVRNASFVEFVAAFCWLSGFSKLPCVDIGGGHGLFVRGMRDRGFDFWWQDAHAENIFARCFEAQPRAYALATLFEVVEHLEFPTQFIRQSIQDYEPQCLLVSTELRPATVPSAEWPYWSFETGQHISFYRARTLEILAGKCGFQYVGRNSMHLLYRRPKHRWAFLAAAGPLRRALAQVAKRQNVSLTQRDSAAAIERIRKDKERFR